MWRDVPPNDGDDTTMMKLALALVALVTTIGIVFGTPSQVGYTNTTANVFTNMFDVMKLSQYYEDNDQVAFEKSATSVFDAGRAYRADAGQKVFKVDNEFMEYPGFETVRFEGETKTVFVFLHNIDWVV